MPVKLVFEVIGMGKPLICLHAFGLDHTVWMDVANLLRPSARVILPDLRGHGGSPSPTGEYTMLEMGEDIINILDRLKLDQAFFAGHSLGGYTMLSLAKNFPDRVAGLALIASHAFADSPETKKTRLSDIEKVKLLGPEEVLSGMPERLSTDFRIQEYCREKIRDMDKDGIAGVLGAMVGREDSIDFLSHFKKPLGIIAGTEDQFIPIETNRLMAKMVNPMLFEEIAGSGHMPMKENPERVAKALRTLFNF